MESVSSLVKQLLNRKPFLFEAFSRGILSYGNLAEEFKPVIEKSLGKEVKESAIVMALRRYADEVKGHPELMKHVDGSITCEILMKTKPLSAVISELRENRPTTAFICSGMNLMLPHL